ncbi:MAG: hypothetical protein AB1792_04220 [Candidatus Zixiibacteriota bacterium]
MRSTPHRVAVCDLGTFSALFLVAERRRGRLVSIMEERRNVDLSYAPSSRALSMAAMRRAIRVVQRFRRLMERHQCDRGAIVCTAAIRRAANRRQVVAALTEATDCPVTVLSSRREGLLAAQGAMGGIRAADRPTLVVDLGGGSTEITDPHTGTTCSLPCGAAWLTGYWQGAHPRRSNQRADFYRREADAAVAKLNCGLFPESCRLVGVGGTITTLATIKAGLREFDPARVHGMALTRSWIARMAVQFAGMSTHQLAALVPFDRARARVLTAGTFLWASVLNRLDAARVTVSVRGLRWGIAEILSGQLRSQQPPVYLVAEST